MDEKQPLSGSADPQRRSSASFAISASGARNNFDALENLRREAERRAYSEEFKNIRRSIVTDFARIDRRKEAIEAELAPTMLPPEALSEWKDWKSRIFVPGAAIRKAIEAERRLAPEASAFDDRMNAVLLKHANVPYGLGGKLMLADYAHLLEIAADSVEQRAYPGSAEARKRYAIAFRHCARDLRDGAVRNEEAAGGTMRRALGTLRLSLDDGTLGLWNSSQDLVNFVGLQADGTTQPAERVHHAWRFIWEYAVVSRLREVLPQRFSGVPDLRTYRADKQGRVLDDQDQPLTWVWDGQGSGMLNGDASTNPLADDAMTKLFEESGMNHVASGVDSLDFYTQTPEFRAYSEKRVELEQGHRAVACEALADLLDRNFRFRHPKHIGSIRWDEMNDDDFERLVFNLVANVPGYSNGQWLTQTRAPDRGRDLSAIRTLDEPITGKRELRVIFQCKHWLSHSIGMIELTTIHNQMALWTPPPLDELIIVTSGRFATDAVQWIEKHNFDRKNPRIGMCPNSHLELLMSDR